MFNFLRKKAKNFVEAWDKRKPNILEEKEKVLYVLAQKIQNSRLATPGNVLIDPNTKNRIREKFYHKYLNIIDSRQSAQNLNNKEADQTEPGKEQLYMPMQPKLKMTLTYVAVGAIILAVILGYYFTHPKTSLDKGNRIAMAAHLAVADGQVETWNGNEWQSIGVGETLGKDSQLKTGENSKAVLEFDEGSALRLDENTHVILQEINNQKITILQVVGETYSRVNKTSGLNYQVKMENTETTALGTAFGVAGEKSNWVKKGEKKIIVKVVESKVKVKIIKNEEALEKEVNEGEELIVDLEKPIENTAKKIPLAKEATAQDGFYAWNREEDSKKEYPLGVLSDMIPPEIKILEPLDGIETELLRVAVKGTTEPLAKVWVNGMETKNNNGNFEKIIDLKIGENTIEVKAKDDSGNITTKKIVVKRKATEATKPTYSLYLKGYADTDGVHLSWSVSGLDVPKGFKIIKSLDAYPTYPEDPAIFVDAGTKNYVWKILDGKTYHFRVCIYKDGGCSTYSNDVKITTKSGSGTNEVKGTISLKAAYLGNYKVKLYWTLSGSAPYGFKLVKSLEPNPVYPGNDYVYLSSPDVRSYVWDMAYPGNYHFRICAYNGNGACVFYSNEITVPVQ